MQFLPEQHILVMNLVRLPPAERSADAVEEARLSLLKPLSIIEAQLSKTEYIAADSFTMGDIPIGAGTSLVLFDLESPLVKFGALVQSDQRTTRLQKHIADPALHLSASLDAFRF